MKDRKSLRRLSYLCCICAPPWPSEKYDFVEKKRELEEQIKIFKGFLMNERLEMIILFDKFSIAQEDAISFWKRAYRAHRLKSSIYLEKPVRERKDNKDVINWGSGGGHRSKIRFPKKVRKTAWKRFYKLFPHLAEKKK